MDVRLGLGSLIVTTALSLGCSVGDPDPGTFTFGNVSAEGGPGGTLGDGNTSPDDTDGDTGVGTDNADGSSGDDSNTSNSTNTSNDGPGCTPSEEVCDGVDNDCDGEIDNGNPEGGAPCDSGMPGVCANGTTACEGGAVACVPDMAAGAETCNGLDDDCNGMIDDGNPEGGQACNTGMPGVCADGISECMVGALGCLPTTTASAELCDNLDNDCDGQVDNGNPGGGGACNTGMPGVCGSGTNTCSAGAITCVPDQMAGNEICNNNLDDDCNGQVDDGCGGNCAHDICVEGPPLVVGCEPCVTQICAVDPFCCSNTWDALCVTEVLTVCGIVC